MVHFLVVRFNGASGACRIGEAFGGVFGISEVWALWTAGEITGHLSRRTVASKLRAHHLLHRDLLRNDHSGACSVDFGTCSPKGSCNNTRAKEAL